MIEHRHAAVDRHAYELSGVATRHLFGRHNNAVDDVNDAVAGINVGSDDASAFDIEAALGLHDAGVDSGKGLQENAVRNQLGER